VDGAWLAPTLVLLALLACSAWVLTDARSREEKHRPVSATVLGITIERPQSWAALCLLLLVVGLPLYLVARSAD